MELAAEESEPATSALRAGSWEVPSSSLCFLWQRIQPLKHRHQQMSICSSAAVRGSSRGWTFIKCQYVPQEILKLPEQSQTAHAGTTCLWSLIRWLCRYPSFYHTLTEEFWVNKEEIQQLLWNSSFKWEWKWMGKRRREWCLWYTWGCKDYSWCLIILLHQNKIEEGDNILYNLNFCVFFKQNSRFWWKYPAGIFKSLQAVCA